MKNDVYYKGLTRNGSDYNCNDGELAESVNLIPENGAMNIVPKFKDVNLGISGKIFYIHSTTLSDNYFFVESGILKVKCFNNNETSVVCSFNLSINIIGEIYNIASIGNTVIITASNGVFYALYQERDYISLGQKPPFVDICFGLKYIGAYSDAPLQMLGRYNKETYEINKDSVDVVTNTITALINKTLQEKVKDVNKFAYPFLIRYAYRLYDGSLYMHSAPILMLPSSVRAPEVRFVYIMQAEPNGFSVFFNACELKYKIQGIGGAVNTSEKLLKWKDIIRTVDIFISEPFNSYNQNGKIEKMWYKDQSDKDYYANDRCSVFSDDTDPEGSFRNKTYLSLLEPINPTPIPMRDKEDILKDITECGIFYKISSIPIEDIVIGDSFKSVDIGKEVISTLQVQERMTDDYLSHDALIAKNSYVYNSRINLSNIKSIPFKGFGINSMTCFGYNIINDEQSVKVIRIYIHIKDASGNIIVKEEEAIQANYIGSYYYYPNPDAVQMTIVYQDKDGAVIEKSIRLKEHKNLNGAVSFKEFSMLDEITNNQSQSSNNYILHSNKIYTSEVNNPFVFNPSGINTVGTGDIIALSSTTKALSQGQFGQFPMYAFSTDGIWALEVNSIGTYSSKQIITRDAINNSNSITQIDGAIIFSTDRGLMLIQGSEVICLSERLNGKNFSASSLKNISNNELGFESMIEVISDDLSFNDYLKGAAIGYDYTNSRLIIINHHKSYQYMYSFLSKSFTKIYHSYEYAYILNNFPKSYIQDKAFNVYDFSSIINLNDVQNRTKGLLISRGMKFDSMGLKTVNRIINRGVRDKESYIKTAIYGSSDGYRYLRLSTLRGKSWKFYRIVLYLNCLPPENLSGTSFDFEQRYNEKMR